MYTFKSFFKFELSAFLGLLALAALLGFAASMCVLFADNGGYSGATIGIIIKIIVLIVVPYCAPFVVLVGIPAYFLFPRPKVIHLRSWWAMLTALIGMGTALLCFPIVDQCEMSFYLRGKIQKTLTDNEKPSLRGFSGLMGSDGVCSVGYAYTHDGQRFESMVRSDFIHGPKISTESLDAANSP